jgi:hypothetical protein
MSITYSECVYVVLVIQHAKRRHSHLWRVRLYHIFPHYLINGKFFRKKKVFEYKICVLILSRTLV